MKPRPSDPSVPPLAEPVHEEAGETSHGPRTTVGKSASDVMGAPAREPQVGEFVGPYPILGELGRGGMAIVFRSKDPSLAREIALKVMLPRTSEADPTAKARFAREADAQAKVDHPHVVAIYQAGEWNGVPYFAMPSLKGQTLAALLKESRANETPLPAAEVVRIGREIAEGLEAAHTAGLVHRDIKPGNIWLEEPRRWVKLLDFGLARRGRDPDRQRRTGHQDGRGGGHAVVHVARTGARRSGRCPHRPVEPRRRPLPDGDQRETV